MTKENFDNTSEPGEQRLAALMRTIDLDAPAPDDALLESLRQRAMDVTVWSIEWLCRPERATGK